MLPVEHEKHVIENLYPITNHVEDWNTFVIGTDYSYIVANVNTFQLSTNPDTTGDTLLNNRATGVMDPDLAEFFKPVWTATLNHSSMQFFMVIADVTYIVNTFPLKHGPLTIGAAMFIRNYRPLPHENVAEIPLRSAVPVPGMAEVPLQTVIRRSLDKQ